MNVEIFCGGMAETNGYLLTRRGAAWAVDAPEGMAAWLAERLRQGDARLAGLLLTHGHWDHIVDAAAIQSAFHVPVWIHHDCALLLEDPSLQSAYNPFCKIPPCHPDRVLHAEERAELAGLDLELFHCPGHCPGSVCYHLKDSKMLFGGDVLFAGGVGRWDLPGGSRQALSQSIQTKILPLPDETRVFPGHGPSTTVGIERKTNPYLRFEN